MAKFIEDFKAFALKGNVVDMAVGVIIGGAFGKIVTSVVNDIIMPPIGILVGGVDFKDLKLVLKDAVPEVLDEAGNVTQAAVAEVTLNYGAFIQNVIDFLIIAFAIFLSKTVLPALGGATIIPLCPFPIGAKISINRVAVSCLSVSKFNLKSG